MSTSTTAAVAIGESGGKGSARRAVATAKPARVIPSATASSRPANGKPGRCRADRTGLPASPTAVIGSSVATDSAIRDSAAATAATRSAVPSTAGSNRTTARDVTGSTFAQSTPGTRFNAALRPRQAADASATVSGNRTSICARPSAAFHHCRDDPAVTPPSALAACTDPRTICTDPRTTPRERRIADRVTITGTAGTARATDPTGARTSVAPASVSTDTGHPPASPPRRGADGSYTSSSAAPNSSSTRLWERLVSAWPTPSATAAGHSNSSTATSAPTPA